MNRDIAEFVRACIAKGEGEESGDTKHDRKYYNIIRKVYLKLKKEQRLDELLPLLQHESPYARLWAASYTLQIDPVKAEEALERLAATRKLMAGFSAQITLREWRSGHFAPAEQ